MKALKLIQKHYKLLALSLIVCILTGCAGLKSFLYDERTNPATGQTSLVLSDETKLAGQVAEEIGGFTPFSAIIKGGVGVVGGLLSGIGLMLSDRKKWKTAAEIAIQGVEKANNPEVKREIESIAESKQVRDTVNKVVQSVLSKLGV